MHPSETLHQRSLDKNIFGGLKQIQRSIMITVKKKKAKRDTSEVYSSLEEQKFGGDLQAYTYFKAQRNAGLRK